MRTSLPIAAAFLLAAISPALAGGGINTDRGDTHPLTFGSVGQASALESASQTADANVVASLASNS